MKDTIVVCGGSKGIGLALCKLILESGHRVISLSRTESISQGLKGNPEFNHIYCDLSDRASRKASIEAILASNERIVGLVNNCSGPITGPALKSEPDAYRLAFETHLYAADEFVKALVPLFKKNKSGKIVNIVSVTAKIPLENMIISNTVRGAVLNWAKTLSKELAVDNITVNNVLPGYTLTDRLQSVIEGVSKAQNISEHEYCEKLISQVPMKRFARPEEVASVARFLLSNEASFVTGVSIPVDGGWTTCT